MYRIWKSRWKKLIAALLLVVSVAIAAGYWRSSVPRLNVVLVTLDTTRADHLGAYGYHRGFTAAFDEFAKSGVIFDRAYSPAPITLPSHATILTGLYPPEHGLRVNDGGKLSESTPILSDLLKQNGYDTGAFIAAVVLDSKYGLARGFDTYDDDFSLRLPPTRANDPRSDGDSVVNLAISWLRQRSKRPFFCWVHLYDAHGVYDKRPARFGNRFEDNPYDAGVAAESLAFGRLIGFLKESKLDRNTLIVVVADHGEGLDDHMEIEHAMLVYETTVRVPLVFAGPAEIRRGQRVTSPVSLVDLMPTVLDLLQLPCPAPISGRSLRPALSGGQIEAKPCYAEAESPYAINRWCPLRALITDRWKYIQTTHPELYDLKNDPDESTNLAEAESARSQEMKNALELMQESFIHRDVQSIETSERDSAKLNSLGYVALGSLKDSTQVENETLPDVKDMLPHMYRYEKARLLFLQNKTDEAAQLFQQVVQERDDYAAAHVMLADCLYNMKRFSEACDAYRKALELRPDFLQAQMNLSQALAAQGRFDDAANELREVIKLKPGSAIPHYELAEILVAMKQYDDAIVEYRMTIDASVDHLQAMIHVGQLLAKLKRFTEASEIFKRALKLNPRNGVVLTNLLNALFEMGDYNTALEYAQQAAKTDPSSFEIRLNLGLILTALKRYPEAIVELREAQRLRPGDPRPPKQIQAIDAILGGKKR